MCGIAGIINGNVRDIAEKQTHRGPDNLSVWKDDRFIELGHNRLSIIDLSASGNQPIENERYVLVYNGEIYNYKELKGYKGGNDAQALLDHITSCPAQRTLDNLNGMYAFALYDKIGSKLHLVVDKMGQKPLYYYHDEYVFAFASSPHALLHLKDKWEIDEQALESYWMLGSVMEESIWKGIKKLNASEILHYDILFNNVNVVRYWQPTYQKNTNGIEDLILDSINKVKVADVPVFLFLSGGIDSTLVASQCEGMHAIHLKSPEEKYAQEAANRFNISLHSVDPRETDAMEGIMDYSAKCGEPSMAGIIPYITARETSKYCKVAITANGADELFFGYDRTTERRSDKQLSHIFRTDTLGGYPSNIPEIDPRLSEGRWLELMTYVQFDLNKTLDFASMAHSLEVRSPFLDHRLVEMALSIPQEKHGRKDILKNMLRRLGFSDAYLNRPKMGFSLYNIPKGMEELKDQVWKWCIERKYLQVKEVKNKRDLLYLRSAALGFYGWHKVWEHKIYGG